MKRLLLLLFILIFACSLILVASANETEQSSNDAASSNDVEQSSNDEPASYTLHPTPLKEYIEEKILPVIVGVITSIIALLSTLKGVFSALKGLKDSKAVFDKEQEKIRRESARELEKITERYGEIKRELEGMYKLSPQIEAVDKRTMLLTKEIANLSKIVSLGYTSDKELIKDGKARESIVLANKNGELIESETV